MYTHAFRPNYDHDFIGWKRRQLPSRAAIRVVLDRIRGLGNMAEKPVKAAPNDLGRLVMQDVAERYDLPEIVYQ